MDHKLILAATAAALMGCLSANAQFYTTGSEPASVKWSYVETPTYRVIYPRGLDSLANVFATTLEQVAAPVGNGTGFTPNASYRKRMPVVLHSYMSAANGVVTWTPRRMELYTGPDAYAPEPTPWVRQLTIHESRHSAQMQFANARPFRFWNIAIGQLASGALAAVYPGPAFFEGDAVVAETALTDMGRGRTADFLEYYRASFAEGQMRDWYKWRWGSQKHYTPDHYPLGYLTMGGLRAYFDTPDFTKRYYERIAEKHGVAFFNLQNTTKEISGLKFKDAFGAVMTNLAQEWKADDASRAPFIPGSRVTAPERLFSEYDGLAVEGGDIYAIRSGLTRADEMVRISPDGKVSRLRPFRATHTALQGDGNGRLYWSEYKQDVRWPMRTFSDIRYKDLDGRTRTLTHGERYYHPAPEGGRLSVTSYPTEGGSEIVILDAGSGDVLKRIRIPDSLQAVETAWTGGRLYFSATGAEGYGIYEADGFKAVLKPSLVKIKQLRGHNGQLLFTSDLTGVNELYSLSPSDGKAVRLTNLREGGGDFRFSEASDTLYYSVLSASGRMIYRTPADSLVAEAADFSKPHSYFIADRLSEGESLLPDYSGEVQVSAPAEYSKLGHLMRFHSWAPLYINQDAISELSFESLYSSAGLGATAFFQNDLGNFYGTMGYHAQVSPSWRHSGHAKFTYTGLYPVIEASVDANDRDALFYHISTDETSGKRTLKAGYLDTPSVQTSLNVYVPFNFSTGGLSIGLVPRIRASFSNDRSDFGNMSRLTATLRGYVVEPIPSSRIYPRLGIGAEAGYSTRPWTGGLLCSNAYGYLYGYLPGLASTHGLKLTAMLQKRLSDGQFCESYANVAPRDFDSMAARQMSSYPIQAKLTADYAMPIFPVDWSFLGPVAYIRNFELTLHGDLSYFSASSTSGNLYSVGADFCVRLGNLLWVPYDTRIGISYNHNGGSAISDYLGSGAVLGRNTLSLKFSVDM